MLTIPKLTHIYSHRKNKTQDQLFLNNLNQPNNQSINNQKIQKTPQTTFKIDHSIKNKQNIPKITTNQFEIEFWLKQLQQQKEQNNKIKNTYRPISNNEQLLSLYQLKQNNVNDYKLQITQSHRVCFSPKYEREIEKNKGLLQSLRQQNQKYKKMIQESENFFKKQKVQTIKINQFQLFHHIIDNNNDTKIKNNDIKTTNKKTNHIILPRKALEEMTNLTSSFIVDDQEFQTILRKNRSVSVGNENVQMNISQAHKPKIQDFHKIKFLGKGNFGQVHLVIQKHTHFICAMKTIKKSFIKEQNVIHQISRQIRIHLSLKHLNVIGFYGFFDDQQNVYLLTEYATGGELYQKLKESYRMPQQHVIPIVKNVLQGLKMIHSLGYIHRDLKPQNIIFQFGIAKICDLGWAADCRYNETRSSFCGTPLYLSPEMIKKQNYDQTIDIWALGILTYELLVGKVPFNIWSEYDLQQIVDKQIVFPTSYVDMSQNSIDFIKKCLTKNPFQRLKIEKLNNHSFVTENENGYFNVQVYDAIERIFS